MRPAGSVNGQHLDLLRREARRDGELIELTSTEFELLALLARGSAIERRMES